MEEIRKLKLALTSSCTLRCNHCNIDKNSELELDFRKASCGVDLLLSSPGKFKRLEIYGGEPFLRFDLVKEISSYAKKKAYEKNKKFSLSIATNATVLDDEKIEWIRKNRINISVSFSGSPESHNYNRIFPDSSGSYKVVSRNIDKLIKKVPVEYLVCLYCVDGGFAQNMRRDFELILKKGFKVVNVECVSGRGWSQKNYEDFTKGIDLMKTIILERMRNMDFIYFEPFVELLRDYKKYNSSCPLTSDLEMYPDGNYGFYPYAFVDYKNVMKKISVGNYLKSLKKRYLNCKLAGKLCDNCCKLYYTIDGLNDGSLAYEIRTNAIKRFFLEIIKKIEDKKVKDYIYNLWKIKEITYV